MTTPKQTKASHKPILQPNRLCSRGLLSARRCRTILLILFLFCALPFLLEGQGSPSPSGGWGTRHLTTDHGLPSPEVYEVLQDRRGYLWFGTDNGVSRYDGYTFRNFGPAQGLKNNVVFYLHEDYAGRIWMITMSENLYYYDYERDSIFAFPYNAVIQKHVTAQKGLLGFHVDSIGTVYRSLAYKGVLTIRPDGQHYLTPESNLDGAMIMQVEGNYLYSENGDFLGFSRDYGQNILPLTYYTGRRAKKMEVPFKPGRHQLHYWLRLENGALLLYCWGNYYLFHGDRLSRHWVDTEFVLSAGCRGRDGRIYLGGNLGAGVRVYEDRRALEANRYTTFLEGHTVTHIYEDRRGGFWFTTKTGVFYAPSMDFHVYNIAAGLPDDNVVAIAVKDANTVWAACGNGIGITASQLRKPQTGELHKSVGMSITRKRLELLEGEGNGERVKVEELKDEDGAVLGTRVTVEVAGC